MKMKMEMKMLEVKSEGITYILISFTSLSFLPLYTYHLYIHIER